MLLNVSPGPLRPHNYQCTMMVTRKASWSFISGSMKRLATLLESVLLSHRYMCTSMYNTPLFTCQIKPYKRPSKVHSAQTCFSHGTSALLFFWHICLQLIKESVCVFYVILPSHQEKCCRQDTQWGAQVIHEARTVYVEYSLC